MNPLFREMILGSAPVLTDMAGNRWVYDHRGHAYRRSDWPVGDGRSMSRARLDALYGPLQEERA